MKASNIRNNLRLWAAVGALGELAFTINWLVASSTQGNSYNWLRDDISEMGALTAPHATSFLAIQAITGIAIIGFVLLGLRPALKQAGQAGRWGIGLAAVSAVQNISDTFFRLDCRAADACTSAQTMISWHAQLHGTIGLVCILALIGSPFMLARRFQAVPEWRSVVTFTRAVGIALLIGLVLAVLPQTLAYHGLAQRFAALLAAIWSVRLAIRMAHISSKAR